MTLPVTEHPSPNHGPRRDGARPSLIVLHYTAMQSAQAALQRLCDPAAEVSSHYLISAKGDLYQLVSEGDRAWHAGRGSWAGETDVNSHSIGIELDNRGTHPFAAAQMDALVDLLEDIMTRWRIPPTGVIGHSDMAPGRKIDPGPHFDWARLVRQGRAARGGHDMGPQDPNWDSFRSVARNAGYTAETSDAALLKAVRLRFRQHATGPLCSDDYTPLGHAALWT